MTCLVAEKKKGAKRNGIDEHTDIMLSIPKQRNKQDPIRDFSFTSSILSTPKQVFIIIFFSQREEKGLTWLGGQERATMKINVIDKEEKSNKKSHDCRDRGHQYFEWLPRNFVKFSKNFNKIFLASTTDAGCGDKFGVLSFPGQVHFA